MGGTGGFTVYVNTAAQYVVTPTGSQVYSGQPTFSYKVEHVPGNGTSDLTGTLTCTGVSGGLHNLDSTLLAGQYRLTAASCSGLSNPESAPIVYDGGGTFTVARMPVTATITGFQPYGSTTPHFTATVAPSGLDLGNDVTCTTVDGGAPISSALHADGSYTLDGGSCSGLFDFGRYQINYVGGAFSVQPLPVEVVPTGSQFYGGRRASPTPRPLPRSS